MHAASTVADSGSSLAAVLNAAWKWFVERLLAPLLAPLQHIFGTAPGASRVAGLALAGLIVGAVLVTAVRIARTRWTAGNQGAMEELGVPLGRGRSGNQWLIEARACTSRGAHAGAIAAYFRAALARLDECDVVPLDEARTPDEYRLIVRRTRVGAAAPFDRVANHFVRALYSCAVADGADAADAARAYDELEPALSAGRRAPG